ncbi:uncharacterized protein LOC121725849 [Aricia agestis]|uniref:uncharacterized protein LOC121725849 n=1 Tax=Aricia agestis TaxID=91739 RepID=UPI001C2026B7|nr:uncharacterized protein LOC121725849 [Aricia agestis]
MSRINSENVNGVNVTLVVNKRNRTQPSQRFTISYKDGQKSAPWRLKLFFLAIIFNVFTMSYIRVSVFAILIIAIVFSVLIIFWITHSVQSESILFIPRVGIESTVKYVFGREDNFVPWSLIDDIIIREVIKLNRVLYYLTIILKSPNAGESDSVKIIPLFKYTKPRLAMLEVIYNELSSFLIAFRNEQMGSGDAEQ